MEDFIDAEDMLDMLFENKVNVLNYLPKDLLRNIASFISEAKDILALHYVSTRLASLMQEELTWKKICLAQNFAFVHEEKDFKSYFFECDRLRNFIRKTEYHTVTANREVYGGNERWLVQSVTLPDNGGTCLEAVTNGVATPIQDPQYIGPILYRKLRKDTLLTGDRRNISLIDLQDGTIYDRICTWSNVEVIEYEPRSKQVFAGMDEGLIQCWRSSRAKVTVGNLDPRYKTADRPCITMKGHSVTISVLLVTVDCTDANQRLVSGAIDGTLVIWQKVYDKGHSYRKEYVLEGHEGPIVKLFANQNLLISTDLITIKVWDQQTGERLHEFTFPEKQKLAEDPEKEKIPQDPKLREIYLYEKKKTIEYVFESCGRVVAISQGFVRVLDITTGELSSSFSLNLKYNETVNGALLSSCYLFIITSYLEVRVWNIIRGEIAVKWTVNRELMQAAFVIVSSRYGISLIGKGPTTLLVISSESDIAGHYYLEFRVSPPRFQGFRKRKREQLVVK